MRTISITFGAGETAELGGGNFFQYLRGDDPIEVVFYRGSARLIEESTTLARPGYKAAPMRQLPRGLAQGEAVGFTSITLKSATAQTIEIGVSMGEGGYNRFTGDSEITGPLDVDGHVETADAKLLALLKNGQDQRAPLTTLAGATIATVVNASSIEVSAAANVNGIIIRFAWSVIATARGTDGNNSGESRVQIDGTPIAAATAYAAAGTSGASATACGSGTIKDLFVPAGQELEIVAGAIGRTGIAYEVL